MRLASPMGLRGIGQASARSSPDRAGQNQNIYKNLFSLRASFWGLESIMGGLGVSGRPWAVLGSLGAFLVLKLGLASGPGRVLGGV